jgi:hypothetical protein
VGEARELDDVVAGRPGATVITGRSTIRPMWTGRAESSM